MLDFESVMKAIESERKYQVRRWGTRQFNGSFVETQHTVCEYMVYMKYYLDEAFKEASTKVGDKDALEVLRKVVTLGVACFEQHGVKPRVVGSIVNGRDGQPA